MQARYTTIALSAARDAHHSRHRAAYDTMDHQCEALTVSVRLV